MPQEPCPHCQHLDKEVAILGEEQMTMQITMPGSLRDWLAGMALQGLLACPYDAPWKEDFNKVSAMAFGYADALLAHRQASP